MSCQSFCAPPTHKGHRAASLVLAHIDKKSAAGGMSSARKGCMESRQRRVCYQSEGEGEYTLTRDAILRGPQITYNGLCPLITCQSFGLDKKLSNPIGLLNFLARFDKKDAALKMAKALDL